MEIKKLNMDDLTKRSKHLRKAILNRNKEFYNNPDKYLSIDDVGDLHLGWFNDRYSHLRMMKNMPIFDKAYELLTKRGNFSRKNAFGEMHCDGFLWIEKCKDKKIIVEERQSFIFLYIKTNTMFHIREVWYKWGYRNHELKGITLTNYRKNKFKIKFEDGRDDGYVLSMNLEDPEYTDYTGTIIPVMNQKAESTNECTMAGIRSLKYWEIYLDDPSKLE